MLSLDIPTLSNHYRHMKIRYQLISAKTSDPSILLHSSYNQVLPARLCHLAMPSSPSRQWWSWIPDDDSRHFHGGPVLKRKRVVHTYKIHQNPTNMMTFLSRAFMFNCSGAGLTSDFTDDTTSGPTQGHQVYYPRPSTMGPPSCFRCCKYCHGPLSTMFVGEQSCRLCQPLATRKPNLWILWQLNLL